MKTIVEAHSIAYDTGAEELFKNLTCSVSRGAHIGLVGKNGSGKSTLLRILAGELVPDRGSVNRNGTVHYLPQLDPDLMRSRVKLKHFVAAQNLVWSELNRQLVRLDPRHLITEEKTLNTLSGGEMMRLLLAICYVSSPDLLILDEPTNHLDFSAKEALRRELSNKNRTFIIVTHDAAFLDLVADRIWELSRGTLTEYGGTFSDYEAAKEYAREARERTRSAAAKALKKTIHSGEIEQKRASRSRGQRKKEKGDRSTDRFAMGYFSNKAESVAGRKRKEIREQKKEQQEALAALTTRGRKRARPALSTDRNAGRRTLVSLINADLCVRDKKLLSIPLLQICYGDRCAILGKNGSGKSSLLRALCRIKPHRIVNGERLSKNLNIVYLDQQYRVVDPDKSIIKNMESYAPELDHEAVCRQLGRFLFFKNLSRRANVLSGGEMACLAFAMVTSKPVDLLILDEPTNNLDLDTLRDITDALEDFPGAILVVSHNLRFLEDLHIKRTYLVSRGRLTLVSADVSDSEQFLSALTRARV